MSELNLTHSNGNKVKLTTPDTLAASKTFKLPGIDGSSRDILTTNGSGALSFSKPGLTLIETKEVASGSASATAFHFNNCFSSTFKDYVVYFNIVRGSGSGDIFVCQFGTAGNGSVVTSGLNTKGAERYEQLGESTGSGKQHYTSSTGIFGLNGSLSAAANCRFAGRMDIIDPLSTDFAVILNTDIIMSQGTNNSKWREMGGSSHADSEAVAFTDIRFGICNGSTGGASEVGSVTFRDLYGHATIFGVNQ